MPTGCRCDLLLLLAVRLGLTPARAGAQKLIATVPTGATPVAVAVNLITNIIFVANQNSNSVTVIFGASNLSGTVAVGYSPVAIAVNPVTNKIYVANRGGNAAVTVIDGVTYSTASIVTGQLTPVAIVVNPVTNRIYVANQNSNTVTVVDGYTNSVIANVWVGVHPNALAINAVTNKVYIADLQYSGWIAVIYGASNYAAGIYTGGGDPYAVAVNAKTNRVYVANLGHSLSVIDGASDSLITNVDLGDDTYPDAVAVNPASNKIYVSDSGTGSVSVIDGVSNTPISVAVPGAPGPPAVNPATNKIYVTLDSGYVAAIDGVNDSVAGKASTGGYFPNALAINVTTNTIYAANNTSNNAAVIAGASAHPLQFVPVFPCRVADTRGPNGPFGGPAISGGTAREFAIPNSACGIPSAAAAYSLNVTVVPSGTLGYLTVWPSGQDQPVVSTLNSYDGRVKANATIVPAGAGGAISIFATNTTHVILDINGYFAPASGSTLASYPLPPCRVVDTRSTLGDLGGPYLKGGAAGRALPLLEAWSCQIPDTAQAYSLNFTAVPHQPLGYLTAWPTGQNQPLVSTLNAPTGTVTANAAIVPAGQGGDISVYVTNDADLIIDINGYFAAPGQGGLALYAVLPCRVLDTRSGRGAFSGKLNPPVNVVGAGCGESSEAQAFVLNATVVPLGPLGYLTLWPDGASQPVVSTLNAYDGAVTSNMAIVPTGNGWIDAYASNPTQLLLDSFSYFGP
jgi:YVTN family beta-propeller protein